MGVWGTRGLPGTDINRISFELVDLDEMKNDYGILYRNIWYF